MILRPWVLGLNGTTADVRDRDRTVLLLSVLAMVLPPPSIEQNSGGVLAAMVPSPPAFITPATTRMAEATISSDI